MIYYSNSRLDIPHMMFIGRWSPFHKGHTAIITKKLSEQPTTPVLILIRNTTNDLYKPIDRAEYIKIWMKKNRIKGTIMIIPNIEGVYWGRGVGYKTEMVNVDDAVKKISATNIRNQMQNKESLWTSNTAQPDSAYMLSTKVGGIIEHGLVIWLTGCPSSGKSTIARACIQKIHSLFPYLKVQLLDGDEMRASPLARDVGFTVKDRAHHILRMAYLAKMFADHGILVVCAFISPERKIRQEAKRIIGNKRCIEVYVKASRKTCIHRDTKGIYKRAIAGTLKNVTGYNGMYEPPHHPNITCNTDKEALKECINKIIHIVLDEQ